MPSSPAERRARLTRQTTKLLDQLVQGESKGIMSLKQAVMGPVAPPLVQDLPMLRQILGGLIDLQEARGLRLQTQQMQGGQLDAGQQMMQAAETGNRQRLRGMSVGRIAGPSAFLQKHITEGLSMLRGEGPVNTAGDAQFSGQYNNAPEATRKMLLKQMTSELQVSSQEQRRVTHLMRQISKMIKKTKIHPAMLMLILPSVLAAVSGAKRQAA